MSEEQDKSNIFVWILLIFGVMVLYIVSYGPAYALNGWRSGDHVWILPVYLDGFYKPALWLYNNTPLGRPMALELEWCLKFANEHE